MTNLEKLAWEIYCSKNPLAGANDWRELDSGTRAELLRLAQEKIETDMTDANERPIFLPYTLPEGWFLRKLEHKHTPIRYKSDIHEPMHWEAEIQHVLGGRLSRAAATTPDGAVIAAIEARTEPDYEAAKRLFDDEAGSGIWSQEVWKGLPVCVQRLYLTRADKEGKRSK